MMRHFLIVVGVKKMILFLKAIFHIILMGEC